MECSIHRHSELLNGILKNQKDLYIILCVCMWVHTSMYAVTTWLKGQRASWSHLYTVCIPGIKPRMSGLAASYPYPLSHLTDPGPSRAHREGLMHLRHACHATEQLPRSWIYFLIKRKKKVGSVEMAQQLRTSIVLVEDPSSVLSTGMELTTN